MVISKYLEPLFINDFIEYKYIDEYRMAMYIKTSPHFLSIKIKHWDGSELFRYIGYVKKRYDAF